MARCGLAATMVIAGLQSAWPQAGGDGRASTAPVDASGQSQLPGGGPRLVLPGVVLLSPASDSPLPIEIVPADLAARGVLVRVRGLPPTFALSDGHSVAPGSWAVPVSSLARLRVIVPAGVAGKSEMTVTLVTIDGTVIAEARTSIMVAAAGLIAPKSEGQREARSELVPFAPPPVPRPAPAEKSDPPAKAPEATGTESSSRVPAPTGEKGPAEMPAAAQPPQPPPPPPAPAVQEKKVAAIPVAPAPAPPAVAPAAPPVLTPEARQRAETMLKRGMAQLAEGSIVNARLFFERAAAEGLAEAALALGGTYDPLELAKLRAQGIRPDRDAARRWYEKAAALGSAAATKRLEALAGR